MLFDLQSLKKTKVSASEPGSVADTFISEHMQKIDGLKELAGKVPEPGEIIFLWSVKSFNAFTFLPYLIKVYGKIEQVHISTYSMNKRISEALLRLLQKELVGQIEVLIADSIRHRMPKVVDILESMTAAHPNLTVRYAWNHSKVMLVRCGDNHFVIEGSGNFSENSRNEQYIWLNNKRVYEFRKSCIHTCVNL